MAKTKEVTLKDLVGKHVLTGVDSYSKLVDSFYEKVDANCISFILDGRTYTAVEDPDDGYRSSMQSIFIDKVKVKNTFPEVQVLCVMKENSNWEENDILSVIDVDTGALILEVGTGNTDDYYPYFVGNWYPENINYKRKNTNETSN